MNEESDVFEFTVDDTQYVDPFPSPEQTPSDENIEVAEFDVPVIEPEVPAEDDTPHEDMPQESESQLTLIEIAPGVWLDSNGEPMTDALAAIEDMEAFLSFADGPGTWYYQIGAFAFIPDGYDIDGLLLDVFA